MPPLHSLGGQPAPPDIAKDLAKILDLPAQAKAHLWEILGPCLVDPLPDSIEGKVDAFCRALEAPPGDLAVALKASRFLLMQAGARGLPRERFAEDLAALSSDTEVRDVLLAGYDAAMKLVQHNLLRDALLDHGNVLSGVDWRMDQVTTSNRGGQMQAPVGVLTLRFRTGGREERLTVQVVPEALRELHRACEGLAAAAKRMA
jgi:hypothetical protein